MATPPPLMAGDVETAIESIRRWHDFYGDARAGELGELPGEVLSYLRRRAASLPAGLRVDELDDVATLLLHAWWQHQNDMRFWLDQVVKLGADRRAFARRFGVTTRQGFSDWRDRLHQLLDATGSGRPDEQAARDDRRAAAASFTCPRCGRTSHHRKDVEHGYCGACHDWTGDPQQTWLRANMAQYERVARWVVDLYMLVDEQSAEHIAEVRRDLREGSYGVEHLPVLGLAVDALRECQVRVRRRRLEEGESYTAQQDADHLGEVHRVGERIAMLLRTYDSLQSRSGGVRASAALAGQAEEAIG